MTGPNPVDLFLLLAREHTAIEGRDPEKRQPGWQVLPLDAVSAWDVVETWRLRARGLATVAQLAREWKCPKRWVKGYFATIGLYLAFDEECERARTKSLAWLWKYYGHSDGEHVKRRISRAKYHAQQSLNDGLSVAHKPDFALFEDGNDGVGGDDPDRVSAEVIQRRRGIMSSNALEGFTAHTTLFGLAEEPLAPGFTEESAELREVATAKQELELLDAYVARECASYAEVDRLLGWRHGQARVIAKRLEKKVIAKRRKRT